MFARVGVWLAKHAEESKKHSDRESGVASDDLLTTDGKSAATERETKTVDGLLTGKDEKDGKTQTPSIAKQSSSSSEASTPRSGHKKSPTPTALIADRMCSVAVEYSSLMAS